MVDFTKVRIGEIGSVVTGRTPKTSVPENYGSDFMFIGPSDLHKHFIVTNAEKMITEKGLASIKSATIDGLSICTGCIGWDMGNVALVEGECATNQQINTITKTKAAYSPYYIYYWLKGRKDYLFQQASVTRTPILNKTDFSNIEIDVPSREYQDKVASFLVAIDKKIELNNKINAELEAMAKLIYDYWFVQFDFPDADGKPYKSSGGKMVYDETLKREIPDGWEARSLDGITNVSNESLNPADFPSQEFKLFSIPTLDATNSYGLERGSSIGSDKFVLEGNDLVVSKLNPWFNRVVYVMNEADQICSTEFVVWRTPSGEIKNYLYMVATSQRFITFCTQSATGTSNSHKRLNPKIMMSFKQPFCHAVAVSLGERLEPMLKKCIMNRAENIRLSELRDWLLPMLMNGQVTVNDSHF